MGSQPKAKDELKSALTSVNHAKELLNDALNTVEDANNRQLLQNTLSSVNDAVNATKTSSYGFKD